MRHIAIIKSHGSFFFRNFRKIIFGVILSAASGALLLGGCVPEKKIPAVEPFDIRRYQGKWYEILRLPNRFERGLTGVTAEYTCMPDGRVRVINSGYRKGKLKTVSGFAEFAGKPGTGDLKVSFFRPFYGSYRIIKLAPDYRYSVVTGSSRSLLWILGREKQLSEDDMFEIISFLRSHRFPVEKLTCSK